MNRRTALAALLALPAVAAGTTNATSSNGGRLYVADLFRPLGDDPVRSSKSAYADPITPDDFDFPETPREVACFLAHWEFSATKQNERDWHCSGHVVPIQWSKDAAAFIGIGPDPWLTDRAARVMARLSEIDPVTDELRSVVPIVGCYRTPCGHAWSLVVEGVLSEGFRAEFRRPLWHTGPRCESCG